MLRKVIGREAYTKALAARRPQVYPHSRANHMRSGIL